MTDDRERVVFNEGNRNRRVGFFDMRESEQVALRGRNVLVSEIAKFNLGVATLKRGKSAANRESLEGSGQREFPRRVRIFAAHFGARTCHSFPWLRIASSSAIRLASVWPAALIPPPGARAVIAADVDDERVVELALVLDFLNLSADLVVGVGEIGGIDIGPVG